MIKTKILLCIFFIGFFALFSHGQNLTYQVDGNNLYSNECDDCVFAGGPDFRVYARVQDQVNTTWSNWNFEEDDSGRCGWFGVNNLSWRNNAQGNDATVITVQLDAREDDNSVCGGSDGDCPGYATVGTNQLSLREPCTWYSYTEFRSCDGVQWGIQYSYYYTYNDLFPGTVTNASASSCSSFDPTTILNVSSATKWATYQWEMSVDGGAWTTVGGAISVSYNPPLLTQTTSYRRKANDCSGRTKYSNVVTYTINSPSTPYTSLASPASTDICSGQSITLQVAGGSNGTGATTIWYDDAGLTNQVFTGNPFSTGALTSSQTYYVVRSGTCNATSAFEVDVNVETEPTPYNLLVSPNPAVVCVGQSAEIEVGGGSGSTTTATNWYSDPTLTSLVGSGNPFTTVPITSDITYYVVRENYCARTQYFEVNLTVTPDTDGDGLCDVDDIDDDNDGLLDLFDNDPLNPFSCIDSDGDGCDDCSIGVDGFGPLSDNVPSNDGTDTDSDGICDFGDSDDDNDGIADIADLDPLNPNICEDADNDGCDDCSVGTDGFGPDPDNNPANDGADLDGDGICDLTDTDRDNDGVTNSEDADPNDPLVCRDLDNDGCDDCSVGVDGFGPANDFDPANDGPDVDADGICDSNDMDTDNDGVTDLDDLAPNDPFICRDVDGDGCDDCSLTGADNSGGDPANDGPDNDMDGLCDSGDDDDDNDGCLDVDDENPLTASVDTDMDGFADDCDPDDDNDGVADADDTDSLNPNVCADVDADGCDDCAVTGADNSGGDPANDGPDTDGDGICDSMDMDIDNDGVQNNVDTDPFNPNVCADADADGCDDCAVTGADNSGGDPANDGLDTDGDGLCDAGGADMDNDNDGVANDVDTDPLNPNVCADADADGCDDCAITGADNSGGDPANDGVDTDMDGICDASDLDIDNDGVANADDADPLNPNICRDLDGDSCDDCSVTGADNSGGDVMNDGLDTDANGICDAGEMDMDGDGVGDDVDLDPNNPFVCADADADGCDDCSQTGADGSGGDPANDGLDTDGDGLCDNGDADIDNDGVLNDSDTDPLNPFACADADFDGCDDCSIGVDGFGPLPDADTSNDGPDNDGDGVCDNADSDDDNDGVGDNEDLDPLNPFICDDLDGDGCDDCSVGVDGFGPQSDRDPFNDGLDTDGDGFCDFGDNDDDNDGVEDALDSDLLDPFVCADVDADGCDDCAVTGADNSGGDVANDGSDADMDGLCDAGDPDDDNDDMPDDWEIANGLDPLDPTDAAADPDMDGISNLDEFLGGTDPNVSDTPSCPFDSVLEEVRASGDATVFEAENNITSTDTIQAGAAIEYSAGFDIDMLPGFEVEAGGELHAYILGCFNPSLQSNTGQYLRIVTTNEDTQVVTFTLTKTADVTIQLFHSTGEVKALHFVEANVTAGTHEQVLNVAGLNAGIYICKVTVGKEVFTAKVYID